MIGRTYGKLRRASRDESVNLRDGDGFVKVDQKRAVWRVDAMEPHVRLAFKNIFRGVPAGSEPPYHLPATPRVAADLDWFMIRYPLEIAAEDARAMRTAKRAFRKSVAELERFKHPLWVPPASARGLKAPWVACQHQARDAAMLKTRGSLLVADEGSLGKTLAHAKFLVDTPEALPGAIVVKPDVFEQWKEKIESYTDFRVHLIEKATRYDVPPADVYIWRYSQLIGWGDWFADRKLPSVGFDEIQELRTGIDSGKGRAARTLARHARWRGGYSGTPAYNYAADETWEIFQFLDWELLGPREAYLTEWATAYGDHWVCKDKHALRTFLLENGAMVRHRRKDLPPEDLARMGGALPVPPPPVLKWVDYDSQKVRDLDERARSLAMRLVDSQTEWSERGRVAREFDLRAREATGVAKAASVAEFVASLLDGGVERLILWGWHREVYRIWNALLARFNPVMHTGSETPKQKRESIRRFLKGDSRLVIMSLRSGAGVDGLQYGCHVGVAGELDWSPKVHLQNRWRIERFGQKYPVQMYLCVADNGSDPPMLEVHGVKSADQYGIYEWAEDDDPEADVMDTPELAANRLRVLAAHYLDGSGAGVTEGAVRNIRSAYEADRGREYLPPEPV